MADLAKLAEELSGPTVLEAAEPPKMQGEEFLESNSYNIRGSRVSR